MPTKAQNRRPFLSKTRTSPVRSGGPHFPVACRSRYPKFRIFTGPPRKISQNHALAHRETLSRKIKPYSCRDPSAKPPRWLTLLVAVLLPRRPRRPRLQIRFQTQIPPESCPNFPKTRPNPLPSTPAPEFVSNQTEATPPPIWAVAAPPRPPSPASLPWRFTSRAPSLGKLPHSLFRHPDSNARAL